METRTSKALYNLKCGEKYAPDPNSVYIRVPGGWVYSDLQAAVFIPFDNEFMPPIKMGRLD